MSITPQQRLSQAYAAPRDARQRRRLAATFAPDARLEQIAAWREAHPAQWERLHPTTRLAVGSYLTAKAAYEAELAASQPDQDQDQDQEGGEAA